MKIIIELKETPRGDVEFTMQSTETKGITRKEACYATNIKDLMLREMPKLCRALGGAGAIFGSGDHSKQ